MPDEAADYAGADPEVIAEANHRSVEPWRLIAADEEGRPVFAAGARLERSPRLRSDALKLHLQLHAGRLPCAACGFDFQEAYGDYAAGYVEFHHARPLWEGIRESTADDLIALCANCHRVAHRRRFIVLSLDALKQLLRVRKSVEDPLPQEDPLPWEDPPPGPG